MNTLPYLAKNGGSNLTLKFPSRRIITKHLPLTLHHLPLKYRRILDRNDHFPGCWILYRHHHLSRCWMDHGGSFEQATIHISIEIFDTTISTRLESIVMMFDSHSHHTEWIFFRNSITGHKVIFLWFTKHKMNLH